MNNNKKRIANITKISTTSCKRYSGVKATSSSIKPRLRERAPSYIDSNYPNYRKLPLDDVQLSGWPTGRQGITYEEGHQVSYFLNYEDDV